MEWNWIKNFLENSSYADQISVRGLLGKIKIMWENYSNISQICGFAVKLSEDSLPITLF